MTTETVMPPERTNEVQERVAVRCSALLADTLRQMIEVIEAHEVTCFSCDRDGELYCDCLKRVVKDAKAKLSANGKLTHGPNNQNV